jgi:anti-anti-sigma factor
MPASLHNSVFAAVRPIESAICGCFWVSLGNSCRISWVVLAFPTSGGVTLIPMAQLGRIASARRDETWLFRLSGEFDLSNAWEVQDVLLESIRAGEHDIVVDLTDVRFMDAQLLRALVKARSVATEYDLAFVVVPPAQTTMSRVADLLDLDDLDLAA